MTTKARLGIDITAIDKSRAAFASINRNLASTNTALTRGLKGAQAFQRAFAVVTVGVGARGVWEQMGKTIDRNTVEKADKFKDSWGRAGDFFLASLGLGATVLAVKFDELIAQARILAGLSPQSSNDIIKGDFRRPSSATGSEFGKALGPNTTEVFRQAESIQTVNRALKESAAGYKEAAQAQEKWSFNKDLIRGLDEEISLLKIRVRLFGSSEAVMDAAIGKQMALNEAIAAGHPLSERELILLEERISMKRKLNLENEALEKERARQEELAKRLTKTQQLAVDVGDAFRGWAYDIESGVKMMASIG